VVLTSALSIPVFSAISAITSALVTALDLNEKIRNYIF
jgi:hypothetical protein